jgi:addiction module RelE/StbE family toxin
VEPDWLLLYRVTDEALILVRTGSHAELFGL